MTVQTTEWSESALRVLRERYLLKKNGQVIETPDEMCARVAGAVAEAEHTWGDETDVAYFSGLFTELIRSKKFVPNSPTLMNAGAGNGLQLSACYVVPVEDSIEGIFKAVQHAAMIHQSGGGTGFSFSRLRPSGSLVKTTQGVASGPVSFMRVFDSATESIKQGGKRRGANMGILRVDHPDIQEFIHCKDEGGITNFNISVAITDKFMDALYAGRQYELIDPTDGSVVGRTEATEIWEEIVNSAWRTGDPGLVFIDRINASTANPLQGSMEIESTNPCGEQPLFPYDVCNLGSINLAALIDADGDLDWEELRSVTRLAVRFLDDVIEVNPYPLPEIHELAHKIRRIGLGVMGWADLLFKLGIAYDSEEALGLAERVMRVITDEGHSASEELADERGPFPAFSESIYRFGTPLRNCTVTTIAPTGTISIIADCSSGIEPIFALAYQHRANGRVLDFVNKEFAASLDRLVEFGDLSGENALRVLDHVKEHGSLANLHSSDRATERALEYLKPIFRTAQEIEPHAHVAMQAAFQKYTDNGVSKTINLPNEATRQDIRSAYHQAWDTGCLGITVFRDGCKGEQVLNVGSGKKEASVEQTATITNGDTLVIESTIIDPPATEVHVPLSKEMKPRPRVVTGTTHRIETPVGSAFITVNRDEAGEPFEVFINVGKAGSDIMAMAEALGRVIALVLRIPSPMDVDQRVIELIDQLDDIAGSRSVGFGPNKVFSLPDAVAQVLREIQFIEVERQAERAAETAFANLPVTPRGDICPECGVATFVRAEGCQKCFSCGYSAC